MKRSRKIIVVAHCILNVNSKVKGLALYEGAIKKLVKEYLDLGYGIVQLPCPENSFIGINRWGMSKNQYNTYKYREHCQQILQSTVQQLIEYHNNGYQIVAIVGINGSPSCGVNYHSAGYQGGMPAAAIEQNAQLHDASGFGIMFEELDKMLLDGGIAVEFLAIEEKEEI